MLSKILPYYLSGVVCKGFGRGSKELGIPTANYSDELVNGLPEGFSPGIYMGWCQVNEGPVHKMVMSVGWNPFYNNTQKTVEIHIMHKFEETFYGAWMRTCVLEYLRPERNFNSVEELIEAINGDISQAAAALDLPHNLKFRDDEFFKSSNRKETQRQ